MSLQFGAFVFHADRRQLLRDGAEVHLTPKAFDLLALLIARAPAVVPKAEIHEQLWPGTFVSDATLAGLVKEVRRALGDDRAGRSSGRPTGWDSRLPAPIDATSVPRRRRPSRIG